MNIEINTQQVKTWSGHFGKDYTDRNFMSLEEMEQLCLQFYGVNRIAMNGEFLGKFDKALKILEVGSNIGNQLLCLQKMGFNNLYGIELQQYAVERAKERTHGINMIQGSAFDIPFKDRYFDLVFTSGVLIHIAPDDLQKAINEMYRCSTRWIWGLEYYSASQDEIKYRDKTGLLWKNDFAKLFIKHHPDLKIAKEKRYKYLQNENIDTMYLLEKMQ